jgi:hypothetical protein
MIKESKMPRDLLRKFIREEIGRNYQTINPDPYTFADFEDYNIEIDGSDENGFFLRVEFQGEKISPVSTYSTYEEAYHASRMVVDHDRTKRMNS